MRRSYDATHAMTVKPRDEECLDRNALDAWQRKRLVALWKVIGNNAFWQRMYAGFDFAPKSDALTKLPLCTRRELEEDQRANAPYGSNLSYPLESYCRHHQTSGSLGTPLRWLDTKESWSWWKRCWSAIYAAAGVTERDRLFYPFSFGPFVGFWSAFESAYDRGNFCLPAGGMTTAARLQYLLDHRVTIVCCTPTYALRMAEVAQQEGNNLSASPVRALIVAGEPGGSVPGTRRRIEEAWGARVFDHVGMTEMGAWGFECVDAPGFVHIMENEFIAEVIDPDTGEPVDHGTPGELVLTNLGRLGSPLIRYRTGDRVVLDEKRCPCGRTLMRIEGGVQGRLDDMLVIRGNNVFPSAIESVVREFDEIAEFGMVVDEGDRLAELELRVEPTADAPTTDLAERVAGTLRDRLHFRPRVVLVSPGSLPRGEMKSRRLTRRGAT